MVCEICQSQSIRKVDGVFVCQECGTEYSVEDAKKLLVEVDDVKPSAVPSKETNKAADSSNMEKHLLAWLGYIKDIHDTFDDEFDVDLTSPLAYSKGFTAEDCIYKDKLYSLPEMYAKFGNGDETESILAFHKFHIAIEKEAFIQEFRNKDSFFYKAFSSMPKQEDVSFTTVSGQVRMMIKNTNDYIVSSGQAFNWWTMIFPSSKKVDESSYEMVSCTEEESFCNWINNFDFDRFSTSTKYYVGPVYKYEFIKKSLFGDKYDCILLVDSKKLNEMIKEKQLEINRKYETYYSQEIQPHLDEKIKVLNEAVSGLEILNNLFPIPKKYRTTKDLCCMLTLVKDRRVSSHKELLDKYDTDVYRAESLAKLDNIEASINNLTNVVVSGLSLINSQLNSVKSVLNDINNNLYSIDNRMYQISNTLTKINRNTFITMWNAL